MLHDLVLICSWLVYVLSIESICQLKLEAEAMDSVVRKERRRAHRSLKDTMKTRLAETYKTCAKLKGKNSYKKMKDTMRKALLPEDKNDADIFEKVRRGLFDTLKVSIIFALSTTELNVISVV